MGPTGAAAMNPRHVRVCTHCNLPYDWRKSPSESLKMTFCGSMCERAHLGFTIEALLQDYQVVKLSWRTLLVA